MTGKNRKAQIDSSEISKLTLGQYESPVREGHDAVLQATPCGTEFIREGVGSDDVGCVAVFCGEPSGTDNRPMKV